MAAGEGIETILSVRQALPNMPMVAALSGAHLAAILFPAHCAVSISSATTMRQGDVARDRLFERADAAGIEAIVLSPVLGDFNEDLGAMALMRFGQTPGATRPAGRLPFHGPDHMPVGE